MRKISTPSPPPQSVPADRLPPSRLASWLFTSVIIGWAAVYNVLRINGRSPHGAAGVSFLIGLGVGAILFVIAVMVWRKVVSGARYRAAHMNELPPATRLDARQRGALDLLWPAVAVLALLLLVTGGMLVRTWLATSGTRSMVRVVIGGWDVLVGAWLVFEAGMLRRHDGEAVESIGTSALLSAVLGGVALSMDMVRPLQGAVVLIATVTATLGYLGGWRLLGSRGIPFAAIGAVLVGAASLAIPLFG